MRSARSLFVLSVGALLWLVAAPLFALEFDRYHTQEEINSFMRSMAADHPELVRYQLLGYSAQGRDIAYVVLTKGSVESLPALYLNGTHHGDEKASTEGLLGLIDYLILNRDTPAVSQLLENFAIYLQPLVNPDGHARNTREDASGVDPNRDYGYPERRDDRAFSTPAIRLVKELIDQIRPRAAVAYHSGMEGVLWPLCYTGRRTGDHDLFHTLARSAALAMGMRLYTQSYNDYPTSGEFIDYAYLTHNTLALTFEVSRQGNPPRSDLLRVVQRSVEGAMTFMTDVLDYDRGELPVRQAPTPAALVAAQQGTGARLE